MSVVIRLSRVGTKHVPFFRMVVVDSRKKRDGAAIEVIGTFDGLNTKLVQFKPERYEEWVKKGAQPSDTAKKIYKQHKAELAGKVEKPKKAIAKKAAPKAEAKQDAAVEIQEASKAEAPQDTTQE